MNKCGGGIKVDTLDSNPEGLVKFQDTAPIRRKEVKRKCDSLFPEFEVEEQSAHQRPFEYSQKHCWQYDIRLNNRQEDLKNAGLTEAEVSKLTISDFQFNVFDKYDKRQFNDVKSFIERHEWLGSMSLYPTLFFTAKYKGILAGAVIMDVPAVFSKILGEETKKWERLISRGACISWSPKNLASALLMWAIKWAVANTQFRVFTAYSDPEAKEIGTIYQACNFIYLGQNSGTKKKYKVGDKWTSDRYFRTRSAYKRFATQLGIRWGYDWNKGNTIYWDRMSAGVVEQIKNKSKEEQAKAEKREAPTKHKYVYILGRTRKETKELKNLFKKHSPKSQGIIYPKR